MSELRDRGRWALAAVLGVVLVLLLVLGRPGGPGEPGAPAADLPASPGSSETGSEAGPVPSEEQFCSRYLVLAAGQGQYAAQPDETSARLLRDAAEELVSVGVPASMSPLARTGYRVEISGIYDSLGEDLPAAAVPGALGDEADGSSLSGVVGAFGDWLAQYCPAR
ncbi:hypothetical protein ACJ5H2_01485 [Nocardioides sp. R1-1]|uniref:hypothetical protein n=1 Tax=Nocardioides sp. R1-1 TaxID=3383502 RepID=UPI0038D1AB2F